MLGASLVANADGSADRSGNRNSDTYTDAAATAAAAAHGDGVTVSLDYAFPGLLLPPALSPTVTVLAPTLPPPPQQPQSQQALDLATAASIVSTTQAVTRAGSKSAPKKSTGNDDDDDDNAGSDADAGAGAEAEADAKPAKASAAAAALPKKRPRGRPPKRRRPGRPAAAAPVSAPVIVTANAASLGASASAPALAVTAATPLQQQQRLLLQRQQHRQRQWLLHCAWRRGGDWAWGAADAGSAVGNHSQGHGHGSGHGAGTAPVGVRGLVTPRLARAALLPFPFGCGPHSASVAVAAGTLALARGPAAAGAGPVSAAALVATLPLKIKTRLLAMQQQQQRRQQRALGTVGNGDDSATDDASAVRVNSTNNYGGCDNIDIADASECIMLLQPQNNNSNNDSHINRVESENEPLSSPALLPYIPTPQAVLALLTAVFSVLPPSLLAPLYEIERAEAARFTAVLAAATGLPAAAGTAAAATAALALALAQGTAVPAGDAVVREERERERGLQREFGPWPASAGAYSGVSSNASLPNSSPNSRSSGDGAAVDAGGAVRVGFVSAEADARAVLLSVANAAARSFVHSLPPLCLQSQSQQVQSPSPSREQQPSDARLKRLQRRQAQRREKWLLLQRLQRTLATGTVKSVTETAAAALAAADTAAVAAAAAVARARSDSDDDGVDDDDVDNEYGGSRDNSASLSASSSASAANSSRPRDADDSTGGGDGDGEAQWWRLRRAAVAWLTTTPAGRRSWYGGLLRAHRHSIEVGGRRGRSEARVGRGASVAVGAAVKDASGSDNNDVSAPLERAGTGSRRTPTSTTHNISGVSTSATALVSAASPSGANAGALVASGARSSAQTVGNSAQSPRVAALPPAKNATIAALNHTASLAFLGASGLDDDDEDYVQTHGEMNTQTVVCDDGEAKTDNNLFYNATSAAGKNSSGADTGEIRGHEHDREHDVELGLDADSAANANHAEAADANIPARGRDHDLDLEEVVKIAAKVAVTAETLGRRARESTRAADSDSNSASASDDDDDDDDDDDGGVWDLRANGNTGGDQFGHMSLLLQQGSASLALARHGVGSNASAEAVLSSLASGGAGAETVSFAPTLSRRRKRAAAILSALLPPSADDHDDNSDNDKPNDGSDGDGGVDSGSDREHEPAPGGLNQEQDDERQRERARARFLRRKVALAVRHAEPAALDRALVPPPPAPLPRCELLTAESVEVLKDGSDSDDDTTITDASGANGDAADCARAAKLQEMHQRRERRRQRRAEAAAAAAAAAASSSALSGPREFGAVSSFLPGLLPAALPLAQRAVSAAAAAAAATATATAAAVGSETADPGVVARSSSHASASASAVGSRAAAAPVTAMTVRVPLCPPAAAAAAVNAHSLLPLLARCVDAHDQAPLPLPLLLLLLPPRALVSAVDWLALAHGAGVNSAQANSGVKDKGTNKGLVGGAADVTDATLTEAVAWQLSGATIGASAHDAGSSDVSGTALLQTSSGAAPAGRVGDGGGVQQPQLTRWPLPLLRGSGRQLIALAAGASVAADNGGAAGDWWFSPPPTLATTTWSERVLTRALLPDSVTSYAARDRSATHSASASSAASASASDAVAAPIPAMGPGFAPPRPPMRRVISAVAATAAAALCAPVLARPWMRAGLLLAASAYKLAPTPPRAPRPIQPVAPAPPGPSSGGAASSGASSSASFDGIEAVAGWTADPETAAALATAAAGAVRLSDAYRACEDARQAALWCAVAATAGRAGLGLGLHGGGATSRRHRGASIGVGGGESVDSSDGDFDSESESDGDNERARGDCEHGWTATSKGDAAGAGLGWEEDAAVAGAATGGAVSKMSVEWPEDYTDSTRNASQEIASSPGEDQDDTAVGRRGPRRNTSSAVGGRQNGGDSDGEQSEQCDSEPLLSFPLSMPAHLLTNSKVALDRGRDRAACANDDDDYDDGTIAATARSVDRVWRAMFRHNKSNASSSDTSLDAPAGVSGSLGSNDAPLNGSTLATENLHPSRAMSSSAHPTVRLRARLRDLEALCRLRDTATIRLAAAAAFEADAAAAAADAASSGGYNSTSRGRALGAFGAALSAAASAIGASNSGSDSSAIANALATGHPAAARALAPRLLLPPRTLSAALAPAWVTVLLPRVRVVNTDNSVANNNDGHDDIVDASANVRSGTQTVCALVPTRVRLDFNATARVWAAQARALLAITGLATAASAGASASAGTAASSAASAGVNRTAAAPAVASTNVTVRGRGGGRRSDRAPSRAANTASVAAAATAAAAGEGESVESGAGVGGGISVSVEGLIVDWSALLRRRLAPHLPPLPAPSGGSDGSSGTRGGIGRGRGGAKSSAADAAGDETAAAMTATVLSARRALLQAPALPPSFPAGAVVGGLCGLTLIQALTPHAVQADLDCGTLSGARADCFSRRAAEAVVTVRTADRLDKTNTVDIQSAASALVSGSALASGAPHASAPLVSVSVTLPPLLRAPAPVPLLLPGRVAWPLSESAVWGPAAPLALRALARADRATKTVAKAMALRFNGHYNSDITGVGGNGSGAGGVGGPTVDRQSSTRITTSTATATSEAALLRAGFGAGLGATPVAALAATATATSNAPARSSVAGVNASASAAGGFERGLVLGAGVAGGLGLLDHWGRHTAAGGRHSSDAGAVANVILLVDGRSTSARSAAVGESDAGELRDCCACAGDAIATDAHRRSSQRRRSRLNRSRRRAVAVAALAGSSVDAPAPSKSARKASLGVGADVVGDLATTLSAATASAATSAAASASAAAPAATAGTVAAPRLATASAAGARESAAALDLFRRAQVLESQAASNQSQAAAPAVTDGWTAAAAGDAGGSTDINAAGRWPWDQSWQQQEQQLPPQKKLESVIASTATETGAGRRKRPPLRQTAGSKPVAMMDSLPQGLSRAVFALLQSSRFVSEVAANAATNSGQLQQQQQEKEQQEQQEQG